MSGGEYTQMGLRLLTMDRGPNGFGFHMYTDKKREVSSFIPLRPCNQKLHESTEA